MLADGGVIAIIVVAVLLVARIGYGVIRPRRGGPRPVGQSQSRHKGGNGS